jgi:hypothetical protein
MDREQVKQIIREELAFMIKQNKLVFDKPIQILDGNDITLGKTVGTRFGTQGYVSASDTGQKLAFFGKTPISQFPTGVVLQPTGGGTGVTDAIDIKARASISDLSSVMSQFGFFNWP